MEAFENINRILLIKLRHIGDVLLTIPSLRALRQTFPGAHITALVNGGTQAMLAGNPVVDEVIAFDRATVDLPFLSRARAELGLLRDIQRRDFDMTVSLTSGDRAATLALASGARYRLAYDPGRDGFPGKRLIYNHTAQKAGHIHMVLQNLNLLRSFGIDASDLSVDYHIPSEVEEKMRGIVDPFEGKTVHIHPTSRLDIKCWPEESMAGVIGSLLDKGVRVVLTTAPDAHERAMSERILERLPSREGIVDLSGKVTLRELAAVSGLSDAFFGVDSAPMHLAAAVGTPVVALFGPTKPHRWGPWSNAEANRGNTSAYQEPAEVRRFGEHTVLQSIIDCVPCTKTACPRNTAPSECLSLITPETVLDEVFRTLNGV